MRPWCRAVQTNVYAESIHFCVFMHSWSRLGRVRIQDRVSDAEVPRNVTASRPASPMTGEVAQLVQFAVESHAVLARWLGNGCR